MRDARQKIATCQLACSSWSRKYEDEDEDGDFEEDLDNADDTDVENGNYDDECYEDDEESSMSNNLSRRVSRNSDGTINHYFNAT